LIHLAEKFHVFYLFGKSEETSKIPIHPNVFKIEANCNDHYEDIPYKIYDGFRALSFLDYEYIIKFDENIEIQDISKLLNIIKEEISVFDYISLKGIAFEWMKDVNKDIAESSIEFSYYHIKKVKDKRLAFMPSIVFKIPYAGGPAYVLSRKAYTKLTKDTFIKTIYEDNAIGFKLFMEDIKVFKSRSIDEKLILDINIEKDSSQIFHFDWNIGNFFQKNVEKEIQKNCIINVCGGLGNQLFCIAAGLAYCYKYDLKLFLYPTPNSRPYYWDNLLIKFKKFIIETNEPIMNLYQEPSFSFIEIPPNHDGISGYFQSLEYFKNVEFIMKNCIVFNELEHLEKLMIDKYGSIFHNQSVIVHARRGDYLEKVSTHNPLPDSYYINSLIEIKKYVENPFFILLSDDYNYWNESIIFKNENFVIVHESEEISLYLMTRCKHFIIANSTFSWWGAYLAKSITVIAPKDWFGSEGPQNWQDIYCENWICM